MHDRNSETSKDNATWPILECQEDDGKRRCMGRIRPFKPGSAKGTLEWNLCSFSMKLRWDYAEVAGVLATSRVDEEKFLKFLAEKGLLG
jgi:hypothetical protein